MSRSLRRTADCCSAAGVSSRKNPYRNNKTLNNDTEEIFPLLECFSKETPPNCWFQICSLWFSCENKWCFPEAGCEEQDQSMGTCPDPLILSTANEFPCLPKQIAWILATRRVFMYPELLPICSLKANPPRDKIIFTKAEDK